MEQIVGIIIDQIEKGIFLSQPTLSHSILESNGFTKSRASTPMATNIKLEMVSGMSGGIDLSNYFSILGSLSYLAIGTWPDLSFYVNYLARFSSSPVDTHWMALKHLLRYLNGTLNDGILFEFGHGGMDLVTYCGKLGGGGGLHTFYAWVRGVSLRKPNILGFAASELCCNFNMPCRIYGPKLGLTGVSVDSIPSYGHFRGLIHHYNSM